MRSALSRVSLRAILPSFGCLPQAEARGAFCEHRTATAAERGRNCPDCGLPLLWIPPAARLWPR